MSFSEPSGGGGGTTPNTPNATAGAASPGATSPHQNFGQIFSHILEQKYPLAGGLAHMVFGGGPQQAQSGAPAGNPTMASAPLSPMPTGETQQPDMISANAKPPENSGVKSMIMKLLMG